MTTFWMPPPQLSRRQFIRLAGLAAAGFAAGCAANPVTGRSQLMLVSEQQEIDLDHQNSPHQFSADYGPLQEEALNRYINDTGKHLAGVSHRPQMPYTFRGVNATYVNAYAFPGGSIACTRGILLKLDNEAELAALLGHELGHVNARHTAEIMSKSMLSSALVGTVAAYVGQTSGYGGLASQLGMLGSGALLASYSRDNERQADDLGMQYMVKAGYGPAGMVGLMKMLNGLSKHKASATELLFSTHPMSSERFQTAVRTANTRYAGAAGRPLHRQRYMDHTASLRRNRVAIEQLQKGEAAMAAKKYGAAENHFSTALKQMPDDYAGLLMMAKCQLAQDKVEAAGRYTRKAKQVFPVEAQAYYLNGFTGLVGKRYETALEDFKQYDRRLPGNPNVRFFKGYAHEHLDQKKPAADDYYAYLKMVRKGKNAQYAYQRLVQWGYLK